MGNICYIQIKRNCCSLSPRLSFSFYSTLITLFENNIVKYDTLFTANKKAARKIENYKIEIIEFALGVPPTRVCLALKYRELKS